ncbi:MAG: hypothetical protein HQM03_10765 [Magnetococcales bacterium]|nr:hypothetical protein [Magnetococcales bacterium]
MTIRRMAWGLACLALLGGGISGCGYRFPGERGPEAGSGRWAQTALTVEGVKSTPHRKDTEALTRFQEAGLQRQDAVLTRILDNILTTRMGPFAPATSSQEARRLRVQLDAVTRDLILEDRSGRANQYRITITARPILEENGKAVEPGYPLVKGVATYYEPASGTASQAARLRAQTEAMNQLADSLVALLAGDFALAPAAKKP